MPRPRSNALFELGDQWIAGEHGSNCFYRFWHDAGTGRTRRESLRTTDFESAKRKLAEIVVKGSPKNADAFLEVVFDDYVETKLKGKPSQDAADHAASLMLECWGLRSGGVQEDKIAFQLGHKRPDVRTTGRYGEWAPGYLREVTECLDAWFLRLQRQVSRPLFSQGFPKSVRRRTKKAA